MLEAARKLLLVLNQVYSVDVLNSLTSTNNEMNLKFSYYFQILTAGVPGLCAYPDFYDEVLSGLPAGMSQCTIPIGSTFQVVSQDSISNRSVIGNPGGRNSSSL